LSPRERLDRALRRRRPDRVPKEAGFTRGAFELFGEKTGSDSPQEYFGFEARHVGLAGPLKPTDFSAYLADLAAEAGIEARSAAATYDASSYLPYLPEGTRVDEWGIAWIPGKHMPDYHRQLYPLAGVNSVEGLRAYPFPDYEDPRRAAHIPDEVRRIRDAGHYCVGWVGHTFETAWHMRGMDRLFMDMVDNPEYAAALLDAIVERNCTAARIMAEAGVDMVQMGDDVGMQDRLMMSPAQWRTWFKPRLARMIATAKRIKPDILTWYHSDGKVDPIVPDLIEIGLDVLNPIQPECMDQAWLKREFGDRLSFWGGMGIQTTMPFGTPDDVRAEVKRIIDTLGRPDGGLVIAPTHVLEPDVPWENITAFFEAVEEYGGYQ
jgi:uroporphyrinogen decarboxylase